MVLNLGRAAEKASENARLSVENLIQRTGALTLPADLWVDHAGRMRKMRYRVDLPSAGGDTATQTDHDTMSVAMELYEFGVPVRVEPPPPDQVVDLVELVRQQQDSS